MALHHRPKQGFSIPLMKIFKKELWELINDEILHTPTIKNEGIFNPEAIEKIKQDIQKERDIQALTWGLLSFISWQKRLH